MNNFENEHEFEFLEPLFSDFPPVSHNYTLKLNLEWRIVFRAVLVELRQCKIICNDTSDATVLSESSPNFIQWMKIISQKKWTNCVISRKKLPRKSKVCNTFISYYSYEDRYDFSRWKKFTDKRPKTFLYSQGTIYTYEELPSFPVKRKKVEKKRPKRAKKKTVASTVVSPIAPVEVVPVVVSNSVPDSVPNTEPDPVSFISSAVCDSVPNTEPDSVPNFRKDVDPGPFLKQLRLKNIGNIIIAHQNINSLSKRFHELVPLIDNNVDILVLSETKLDGTFPENQFSINGFKKPYRKDRNKFGGGVMIYVREDIPSQEKINISS